MEVCYNKKRMKKKYLFPLALTLILTACGPSTNPTNPTNPSIEEPTTQPSIEPSVEPSTEPSTVVPPSSDPTSVVPPSSEPSNDPTTVIPPSSDPTTVVPPSTQPSNDPTTVVPPSTVPPTTANDPTTAPQVKTVTVSMSKFTNTNGNVGGDSYISYKSYKGGGTSDPAIYNDIIRLYQHASGNTGGYITLSAVSGVSILEAVVGTGMDTTIAHSLDSSSAMSSSSTLTSGSKYTVSDLDNSSITFYCLGKDKSHRLYVNYLEVTYAIKDPSNPPITTAPPTSAPVTNPSTGTNNNTSYQPGESTYTGNYYNNIDTTAAPNTLLGDLRELIVDTHDTYTSYSDCGGGSSKLAKTDFDPNNKSNILLFYSRKSVSNSSSNFNREHVWPKSTGLWETSGGGADMHHIRPTLNNINSARGNKVFGECPNGSEVRQDGYLGGYTSGNVFEPLDAVKGDVARIILYMFVHYNGSGSYLESNTNKSGTVTSTASSKTSGNLPITNVIDGNKTEAFQLLIKWHNEDPVDQIEINRNNAVYDIQGNRNPFIDHPSFADYIWG